MDHPHLHCVVPGGGLSPDGLRFIQGRKKFFIPVKVLSRKFRGKCLFLLKEAYREGRLVLPKEKLMTLSAHEFIRRFLLHVLPERFVKIRHYGTLSNRNRRRKVRLCRRLAGRRRRPLPVPKLGRAGADPWVCPQCGQGRMTVTRRFDSRSLSPPLITKTA